jgi:hypothetical protein
MADLPEEDRIDEEDLKRSVLESLDDLNYQDKLEVLDFTRELARRKRSRAAQGQGGSLLAFAGSIPIEDLDKMERVIEEEFEKVDKEGW